MRTECRSGCCRIGASRERIRSGEPLPRRLVAGDLFRNTDTISNFGISDLTNMIADNRGRRPDNVKTGYLPDAFNPVIIETISFLSVCFVWRTPICLPRLSTQM